MRSDTRRIKEKLHSACASYPNCVPVLTAPSCSICSMVSSEPVPQFCIRFSSHLSTCAQGQFSASGTVNTDKLTYRMELSALSKSSPPTKRHRNRAPMTTLNLMPFSLWWTSANRITNKYRITGEVDLLARELTRSMGNRCEEKQPPTTPEFEQVEIKPRYEKTSSRQRPNNAKSPKPNKNFYRTYNLWQTSPQD